MLALAADHIILDVDAFRATCLAGRGVAEAGRIVTFGIKPTEPKTSYGYILPGEAIGDGVPCKVEEFRREAGRRHRRALCRATAISGIPATSCSAPTCCSSELARLEPEMAAAVEARSRNASNDLGFLRLEPEAFARAPQKSIDYAVMEKTDRAAVVPAISAGRTSAAGTRCSTSRRVTRTATCCKGRS